VYNIVDAIHYTIQRSLSMKHRYTVEQVQKAVDNSKSIAQVLSVLGIVPAGGNYSTINKFISKNCIDISHFTGMLWNKGGTFGPKRPIEDYLSNEYGISSNALRKRLISEGIFKKECSNCHLSKWLDQDIPLELDHINGEHQDNSLDNIRLLCPNCHALTDTYRGKNKKK